jgi:uncharacterized iron-regulated membrane protein
MLIVDERPTARPCTSKTPSVWRIWLEHPERIRLRNALFQIHLWGGAALGMYVFFMSVTGSVLVFRNELSQWRSIRWVVDLHANLLAGDMGRAINGIGAICLTVVCLTGGVVWWPGLRNWRRALTVSWRSHLARLNWDAHSALGFWFAGFVLMWGISGIYFAYPGAFNSLAGLVDPRDRYADQLFSALAELHFGRFHIVAEMFWGVIGLVPAALAITGVFLCCRRLLEPRREHPLELPRRDRK